MWREHVHLVFRMVRTGLFCSFSVDFGKRNLAANDSKVWSIPRVWGEVESSGEATLRDRCFHSRLILSFEPFEMVDVRLTFMCTFNSYACMVEHCLWRCSQSLSENEKTRLEHAIQLAKLAHPDIDIANMEILEFDEPTRQVKQLLSLFTPCG